jgi:lipoprotein-releasing system permease protein
LPRGGFVMSPNFRIAFRFLTAKKRAMIMSLACTILGVGLFIVTQATTSGFEKIFTDTLLGINGAIRIEDRIQDTMTSMAAAGSADFYIANREGVKYIEGVEEPQRLADAVREFPNVLGVSAVVRGNIQLTSAFKTEEAQVFGIHLDDHVRVSNLARQIVAGDLEAFRSATGGALIGRVLADRLQLTVGDSVSVSSRGQSRRLKVSAIFETGYREADKANVYVLQPEARSLLRRPSIRRARRLMPRGSAKSSSTTRSRGRSGRRRGSRSSARCASRRASRSRCSRSSRRSRCSTPSR